MAKTAYICWTRWVSDLRFTWCGVFLVSVLPSVLYGTAFSSMMLLVGGVILGLPSALASLLLNKEAALPARLFRRAVVLTAMPALMLAVIFQTDKLTLQMAAPIVEAVESFKQVNGTYPASLAVLTPQYLPGLPKVRISVFQPEVNYRVKKGHPYLAVPSAAGDAFAIYEYNFEERRWAHYN
ncbi:hypothetical protein EQ828_12135 [Ectopseudomonas mendocina]|nr:hypothetical protein [Pseudomonas mendocina]TRO22381.1 hypothetical protein EQ828_12135 [Pseudomonas mendocina]